MPCVIESPIATHSGASCVSASAFDSRQRAANGSTCRCTDRTPGRTRDIARSTGPVGRGLVLS